MPKLPSPYAPKLHDELVAAWSTRRKAEHRAAVLLARIADQGLHHELGYTSVQAYAAEVLDLTLRQARDLVRIGRRLAELPVTEAAFAEGRLGWTQVRELVRVVTPHTERAWTELACEIPAKQLETLVAASRPGDLPTTRAGHDDEERPAWTRLVFETAATDAQVVREAIAWIRAMSKVGEDVDDGALLAMMLKRLVHDRGQDVDARTPSTEPYRIVVEHCPECASATGIDCELTDTVALEAACDAEIVDLRPGPDQGRLSHTVPPATRRAVLHRDRHRCRVPGCANRNWLHLHHLRSRALGGGNEAANVLTTCDAHHRLVHQGRLGIERDGPDLRFRFPDGRVITVPHDPRKASADHEIRS